VPNETLAIYRGNEFGRVSAYWMTANYYNSRAMMEFLRDTVITQIRL